MADGRCLREWEETEGKEGSCETEVGEAECRGVWNGLINRLSDSTLFCPWDKSSCAHRRRQASGNCG